MTLSTLKKRSDFLRLRGGAPFAKPSLVLETRPSLAASQLSDGGAVQDRDAADEDTRFGYTVTKKLGGAVVRNRIKRRLRAVVAAVAPKLALPGHDYVLVARSAAYDRAFAEIKKDLERALQRVHHAAANPVKNKAP